MVRCRQLELPGEPPNGLRAAWAEMTYTQRAAFLARLHHPATTTQTLTWWLGKWGWRVSIAGLADYRAGLDYDN
jgi:hypothetical protein